MIYLIDHQDSFTYNLAHLLENFDEVYVSNYFKVNEWKSVIKRVNIKNEKSKEKGV